MRSFLKKGLVLFISFVMLLCLVESVFALDTDMETEPETKVYGAFEYQVLNDDSVILTKFLGADGHFEVPSTIEDKKVTEIGEKAFYESNIETVSLPDTITTIGDYAFAGCESLRSVEFSSSLTVINKYAFFECPLLSDIDFPDNLIEIGFCAFEDCDEIIRVDLPRGLTTLGGGSFSWCDALTEVGIPASLKECNLTMLFDSGPFAGCSSLETVQFESGITTIPAHLFRNCGIKHISIPETVKEIETSAFEECVSLETIDFSDSADLTKIGWNAFSRCTSLKEVSLPKNIESMGSSCFAYCSSLFKVVIPASLRDAGSEGAFTACSSLTVVEFEDDTKYIASHLLENCDGIEEVILPDTTYQIYYSAFRNCKNLKKLVISKDVRWIEDNILENSRHTVVYCYADSTAYDFVMETMQPFVLIDGLSDVIHFQSGDVDGDGIMTASDALDILRTSLGLQKAKNEDKYQDLADINGDRKIDSADALQVLRNSMGL